MRYWCVAYPDHVEDRCTPISNGPRVLLKQSGGAGRSVPINGRSNTCVGTFQSPPAIYARHALPILAYHPCTGLFVGRDENWLVQLQGPWIRP